MPINGVGNAESSFGGGGNAEQAAATLRKRDLIKRTLSEDYPGLDYLGFHNVLHAKRKWYCVLWFTMVIVCLLIGLYTIYGIVNEYRHNPSATLISVRSVERLLLPQLTVCATHAATVNVTRMERELFAAHHVANYTPEDVLNFAYFMLAGSGFQMNWKHFNAEQIRWLTDLYDRFRFGTANGDGESVEQFFHYFFNRFGLQCDEFLQDCRLGDEVLDCCKVFTPVYLMRRGRCFRSAPLFQRSYDELGKLRVSLRQPNEMDSRLPTANQEVLAFLAEHKPQVAPFPRYYLYPRTWTKARITAKRISLFPAEEVCSEESSAWSKDVCYIQRWLSTMVERPRNCTLPYIRTLRAAAAATKAEKAKRSDGGGTVTEAEEQLKSCHPSTILSDYENTVEAPRYTIHSCILPCERWEYAVMLERVDASSIMSRNATTNALPFTYRIDVSYNDLQYEEIREVSTVTFFGLIAQIGGQMSLFMGSSILNLTQVLIMAVILCRSTAQYGDGGCVAVVMRQRHRHRNRRRTQPMAEGEEKRPPPPPPPPSVAPMHVACNFRNERPPPLPPSRHSVSTAASEVKFY